MLTCRAGVREGRSMLQGEVNSVCSDLQRLWVRGSYGLLPTEAPMQRQHLLTETQMVPVLPIGGISRSGSMQCLTLFVHARSGLLKFEAAPQA